MNDDYRSGDALPADASGSESQGSAADLTARSSLPWDVEQSLADLPTGTDIDFPQAFHQTLEALAALEARYLQIQRDRQMQAAIQQQLTASTITPPTSQPETDSVDDRPTDVEANLQADLDRLQSWLEILDFNLESTLFRWSSLRDPFWFGLRFGSLGFTLGWLLHACTAS